MQPSASRLTFNPVFPKRVCSISSLHEPQLEVVTSLSGLGDQGFRNRVGIVGEDRNLNDVPPVERQAGGEPWVEVRVLERDESPGSAVTQVEDVEALALFAPQVDRVEGA